MAKTPPIPLEIHPTVTLVLEDGQPTIKGNALVALADATEPTARALIAILAARSVAADSDGKDLGRLIMKARGAADARAAALLIAAIEAVDAGPLPVVGCLAWRKDSELDPRRVTRVEGNLIYIDLAGSEAGPFPASSYTYTEAGL